MGQKRITMMDLDVFDGQDLSDFICGQLWA
jgi:hypothetical protein